MTETHEAQRAMRIGVALVGRLDERLADRRVLEGDILIGADGNTDLMADVPIEPDEIEDLMNL